MIEHKTAGQLNTIARSSDENLDGAVGAVLEVAEEAARRGCFTAHILNNVIGSVDYELVCRRLHNLGYNASTWNRINSDGSSSAGILVSWEGELDD